MGKRTTEDVINIFKNIHGDRYDYSKFHYEGAKKTSTIICKKHGEFVQSFDKHKLGRGCVKCAREKPVHNKIDRQEFLSRCSNDIIANYVIGDYKGYRNKTTVKCLKHNVSYEQTPQSICRGSILCPECIKSRKISQLSIGIDTFEKRAKEIHNGKYQYDIDYLPNLHTDINIKCPEHGWFKQEANNHLRYGCRQCSYLERNNGKNSIEDVLHKLSKVHSEYTYPYVEKEYVNVDSTITIICKKHGSFKQTYGNHVAGHGCRKCGSERASIHNIENPKGWRYTVWGESAKRSEHFDSFKVYIIKCVGNNEEFYKIGKTYRKVSVRFKTNGDIPYRWEICNEFIFDCSRECSEYEDKLRKINKHNRYIPTLSFGGRYECYKEMPIIPENDLKIK